MYKESVLEVTNNTDYELGKHNFKSTQVLQSLHTDINSSRLTTAHVEIGG
jgi:hypothetical protein